MSGSAAIREPRGRDQNSSADEAECVQDLQDPGFRPLPDEEELFGGERRELRTGDDGEHAGVFGEFRERVHSLQVSCGAQFSRGVRES